MSHFQLFLITAISFQQQVRLGYVSQLSQQDISENDANILPMNC